jgi:hypothetical protein
VVYHDGSATDTVIEVFLRHPGRQNTRNLLTVTRNHRWAVYVNPVGVDAAVAPYNARCVASGYMWNPSFVQLTAPVVADQRNVTFHSILEVLEVYSYKLIIIFYHFRKMYTDKSANPTYLTDA